MSEMHAPNRPSALDVMRADVERLNAATPGARFFLGVPENALADYSVRDRLLLDDDVVSRFFGLEAAAAEVERRNDREAMESAMVTYCAIRSSGDILRRDGRGGFRADLGVLVPAAWLWFVGIGLVLALTIAVGHEGLAHLIAGWVR